MGLLLDRLKQIELSSSDSLNQNEQIQDDLNFDRSSQTNRISDKLHASASFTSNLVSSKQNDLLYKAASVKFPDLESIPPELSLQILKYLNATDLCLAACVWSSLANDDILWQSLCKSTWGYATCYRINYKSPNNLSATCYRKLFLKLDEATLTFNADWKKVNNILHLIIFRLISRHLLL
jgi:CRISPR/Cas system CSM-associated protein Csm2 small subunit